MPEFQHAMCQGSIDSCVNQSMGALSVFTRLGGKVCLADIMDM